MKPRNRILVYPKARFSNLPIVVLLVTFAGTSFASTTWYVDGVQCSDSNNCRSASTACQSIGHGIALASSGDSITVAPATYYENLTIVISLNVAGSRASTTII